MRSDVSVGSAAAPQWHDIVQILYKLVDAVSRATAERVIHEEALVALMSSVTPDRAGILVCDDDGVMRFRASRRLSDAYRKAVEGHSPWTRDTSDPQPVVVGDALADETLAAFHRLFREEGLGALAFIPLVAQGTLFGKFMLYFYEAASRCQAQPRDRRRLRGLRLVWSPL